MDRRSDQRCIMQLEPYRFVICFQMKAFPTRVRTVRKASSSGMFDIIFCPWDQICCQWFPCLGPCKNSLAAGKAWMHCKLIICSYFQRWLASL